MADPYALLDEAARDALAVEEPQPLYLELLEERPYERVEAGVYFRRMADILELNRSRDVYGTGGGRTDQGAMGASRPLIPLDLDGPEHTKYRKLLDPLFTPKRVTVLEPAVDELANALVDSFIDRGRAEMYSEFCTPLPSNIFIRVMGVRPEALPQFLEFKNDVIRPHGNSLEEVMACAKEAGARTYAYFNAELDAREAGEHAGDEADLLTALTTAEVEGHRLTRENILDIVYLLMIAGLDTVTASLSCMLSWLARHPDVRDRIVKDPALWPNAIEELMRFESPVPMGSRLPAKDIEINGIQLEAGQPIEISWATANLDPEFFPDPLTVDIDRPANKHVAFASGFHRCLGSHLARMELRVALDAFHRRVPEYAIAPGEQPNYTNIGVRTVDYLPLVW